MPVGVSVPFVAVVVAGVAVLFAALGVVGVVVVGCCRAFGRGLGVTLSSHALAQVFAVAGPGAFAVEVCRQLCVKR